MNSVKTSWYRESNFDVFSLQEVNSRITNFLSDLAFDDPWSIFFMTVLSPLGYIKVIHFGHTEECMLPPNGFQQDWISANNERRTRSLTCLSCYWQASILFWFGDLNFRIADYGIHFVRESINNKRYNLLWEKDQLNMAKKKEAFLQEFIEGPLQFKPTYKFDLYSDVYDTSEKKRKPAWTDRILWRVKSLCQHASKEGEFSEEEQTISVTLNNYISHMSYGISDHKPVTGTFGLELKPLLTDPLITLNPEGEWSAEHDVLIRYSAVPEFPSSAWDWIGLFKVAFRHVNDYVTYAWVEDDEISSNKDSKQVYMSAAEIPDAGGEFLLCYYSNNLQAIVGISQPFQVIHLEFLTDRE
uniref:Inositol polyphosphate-5-phosphatase K n=1 Tax=Anas platyrhynchos platyrhynchos TaxID=8840 RepID=U3IM48_ANAPP